MNSLVALAAIVAAPLVSAHGYVDKVVADGETYTEVSITNWSYGEKKQRAGWFADNGDNGFVEPKSFGTDDIACHKSATAGTTEIAVTAGSTVSLTWNTWPESHHGPILDYLAKCDGSCTSATAGALEFFKIDEQGLIDGSSPPGTWATDKMMGNGLTWDVTIPSSIAAGSYVLRHEIVALHSAGQDNGAQAYPQCINLKVSSSGSASPSGTLGKALYKAADAGILINIYEALSDYKIPGPAVFSGAAKRFARMFKA